MFINNFYKRVILLALEFFEVTVMRRPDHKFRDQWRKAESALQPPSSSAFFFILWPHFLCAFCFLAFHCKNDPLLLNFSHIYLVLPSLQIVSLCFPSVFTIASFFILGQIAVHCTCLSGSHRSWVNWRGNLFYPKHNLVTKSINKQFLIQRREERRYIIIYVWIRNQVTDLVSRTGEEFFFLQSTMKSQVDGKSQQELGRRRNVISYGWIRHQVRDCNYHLWYSFHFCDTGLNNYNVGGGSFQPQRFSI